MKADVTEPLLKRLRMFVLRAKVTIEATTERTRRQPEQQRRLPAPCRSPLTVTSGAGQHRLAAQVPRPVGFHLAPAAANGPGRWWVVDDPDDKATGPG